MCHPERREGSAFAFAFAFFVRLAGESEGAGAFRPLNKTSSNLSGFSPGNLLSQQCVIPSEARDLHLPLSLLFVRLAGESEGAGAFRPLNKTSANIRALAPANFSLNNVSSRAKRGICICFCLCFSCGTAGIHARFITP
jgi:hypothetical protein